MILFTFCAGGVYVLVLNILQSLEGTKSQVLYCFLCDLQLLSDKTECIISSTVDGTQCGNLRNFLQWVLGNKAKTIILSNLEALNFDFG